MYAQNISHIKDLCRRRGDTPRTIALYGNLLLDLYSRWAQRPNPGHFDELFANIEWVENTLRELHGIKSMPTYLGYLSSMLKVYAMFLPFGKRNPQEVEGWFVYAERAAYWRGVVFGMKGVLVDDDVEHVEVETQTDAIVVEDDGAGPSSPSKKMKVIREYRKIREEFRKTAAALKKLADEKPDALVDEMSKNM